MEGVTDAGLWLKTVVVSTYNSTMSVPLEGDPRFNCLEDWDDYSRLNNRRILLQRFGYISVAVPIVGATAILLRFFPGISRTAQNVVFGIVFGWVFFVIVYSLVVFTRFLFIRCPKCGWRFGPGTFCGSCGLPRSR